MAKACRVILAVTCIVVAVILHLSLCRWVMRGGPSAPERLILVKIYEGEVEGPLPRKEPRSRGLITRRDVSRPTAVIFGVAAPILLLGVAQYMLLFEKSRGDD